MPEEYYKEALKKGLKEYKACESKGINPYLQVLDEIIPDKLSASGVSVGVIQIPAEFVVGTKTRGRAVSFARNFMPIIEGKSEFCTKWAALCDAHLREGIRDPLKVYEYMNRFYVEEGNKRASVLKFFGAVNLRAEVIRVMPEDRTTKEAELYLEFLDFYKVSKVNYIEFSKKGSYQELQSRLGKSPKEAWDENFRNRFSTAYHYFRLAFEANGGGKLEMTVGDAMLAYIRVYGYPSLYTLSAGEIKRDVAKIWEEITLQEQEDTIEVKLDPDADKKTPVIKEVLNVLSSKPKKQKVAFLYDKTPEKSGWTMGHEMGRRRVQMVMDDILETTPYFNAMEEDFQAVLEQAIADGNKILFTTSPRMLPVSLRVAVDHPECTILNCSLNTSHRYVRTYYARMYEAKFIIGAIAGTLTESGRVGYICDYPIYGQIAGINAFAQGLQMVNPRAKVVLEWSSVGGASAAMKRLEDQGVHLISAQDSAKLAVWKHGCFGLSHVKDGEQTMLAVPIWRWAVYYETILRQILNKTEKEGYEESTRALNYYWGMSAGVIDVECTDNLPESSKKLSRFLKHGIRSGTCVPFYGPLRMQHGGVIDGEGHRLNLDQIINMDDLMENVIGTIPEYHELTEVGKSTVEAVGVGKAAKKEE